MLREISQRKANTVYHLHIKSKKIIQMNVYAKQKQTQRYRKHTSGYQRKRAEERRRLWIWNLKIQINMY